MGVIARAPVLAAVTLTAAACGSDVPRQTARETTTRDSAGIAIVENAAGGAWEAGEAWTAVEEVEIGILAGPSEYTFNRIRDVAVSAPGRVYVLDAGDNIIKVYDREGRHLFTFGGEGEGPAEFQRPAAIEIVGDTFVVYDYDLLKLARFTLDGALIDTDRAEFSVFEYGFPSEMMALADGYAFSFTTGCQLPAPEDRRPKWKLLTAGRDGALRDTVAMLVNGATVAIYGEGDSFCTSTSALGQPAPIVAARADGVTAFGTGATYEIRLVRLSASDVYGADPSIQPLADAGGILPRPYRIIRRNAPAIPLSDGEIEAYRNERLYPEQQTGVASEETVDPDRVAAFEAAWDSIGFPETRPAFDDMLWDDEGNLWVRRTAPSAAAVRDWDVFDGAGVYLGPVELPAGLRVHAIAAGMAWGTVRDELDVQRVKGYLIRK